MNQPEGINKINKSTLSIKESKFKKHKKKKDNFKKNKQYSQQLTFLKLKKDLHLKNKSNNINKIFT